MIATDLEIEVLDLLVCGLPNPTIATILGVTRSTVVGRLQSLYNKFGFSNRVELALWYQTQPNKPRRKEMKIELTQPELTLLTYIHQGEGTVSLKESADTFIQRFGLNAKGMTQLQTKGNGSAYESIPPAWVDCVLFLFTRVGYLVIPDGVINTRLSTYPGRDYSTTREAREIKPIPAPTGETAHI